jgi:hypothetical protein
VPLGDEEMEIAHGVLRLSSRNVVKKQPHFFNALAGFLLCGLQLTIGRVAKQVGNYLGNICTFF